MKKLIIGIVLMVLLIIAGGSYLVFCLFSKQKTGNYTIYDSCGSLFYVMNREYEGQHIIHETFIDDYEGNEYPAEDSEGRILNYDEYIDYCELFGIEQFYSDRELDYIVVSWEVKTIRLTHDL